jgi:acyl-homoserine-lactone acylase
MRFATLALALAASLGGTPSPARLARSVTIYRDTYGVPHVFAKTDAGAVFGLMYAQAEDNFWQLETDYIRVLGRLAEVDGPAGLANDVLRHAWEVERRGREHYEKAPADLRALCDAFAAGLNYYLERHPETKPRLLTRFEPWYLLADELLAPAGSGITPAERRRAFPVLDASSTAPATPDQNEGSNMWAVSPSRSATGHALLLINPHVGFFGGGQRYEAHLHSDQGLDVSGFAILGTAYIRSGFNRYLGWSHTNNYAQTADVYLETFDVINDPLAYRYGRQHRKAVEWTEMLRVKTAAGVETRQVVFRKTHHGPILGIRAGQGLAVRSAVDGGVTAQRWAMAKARNLREFQAALARRTLTGSNTIYADVEGNIYYVHGNAIPRRSTKYDWAAAVDGADPDTDWQELHTIDELPHVLNPKSGYLQNCNSTAFLTTGGDDNPRRADFPAYMVPEPDTPRAQRSRAILSGDRRFTFTEWAQAGLDTKIGIAAERLRELSGVDDPALGEVVATLRSWDQVARNDSVAATLFVRWEEARRAGAADPSAALARVKADLEAAFGTWRVPWGDVNRLQRIHTSGTQEQFSDDRPSVPVPGAPTFTGTIFTFGTRTVPGQKRRYGTVGDTYVAVVEFGKRPQARSLLVFGESADPASKHYFDQAPLYSRGEFKPAWFELRDVKKHVERKYRPQ